MELSISDIISIITLLLGGGSLGGFLTWKYARRKEQAEAVTAETTAAKEIQDVYQQLLEDIKTDRNEQKQYIVELKEDRQHLRQDRDELRNRQDALEERVRVLQKDVAKNSHQLEMLLPLACGRAGCALRVPVRISATGEIEQGPTPDPSPSLPEGEGA